MRVPGFKYHSPTKLMDACEILSDLKDGAAILAGGTDIVPAMKYRIKTPGHLVNIKKIAELRGVSINGDGTLRLGACELIADLARSPEVRERFGPLSEAARKVASPLIRNLATVGGNICLDTRCWYYNQSEFWRSARPLCLKVMGDQCYVNQKENRCVALFSGDTAPVFMVLKARVLVMGAGGERDLPIEELYTGDGLNPISLKRDEIIVQVEVPPMEVGSGAIYLKYSSRGSIDFPILGVAAWVRLNGGMIERARVVTTATHSAPYEAPGLGVFTGVPPSRELAQEAGAIVVKGAGPLYLSEAVPFKKKLLGVMVEQALEGAWSRAAGNH